MYYPIGWHKVLKLDTRNDNEPCDILAIQANHERELFFILTTKTLHLWSSRPTVEILCHRRSRESLIKVGLNQNAVWRTDSSVIVVSTNKDQLLFYQIRRRIAPGSAATYLLSGLPESDNLFKMRHDSHSINNLLLDDSAKLQKKLLSSDETIPALSIFSFGKLDLSAIGVSCMMSAEEELVIGARNGDMYGINWDGSADSKFPWSIPKEFVTGSEYIQDLKFSSVLSGFALVFSNGSIGFMPLRSSPEKHLENGKADSHTPAPKESRINILADIDDAVCAEINHKNRLVAFGLKSSRIVVCGIGDSNTSLVINHVLELQDGKLAHGSSQPGAVNCMRYSPDSFALATSWDNGDFAIWSVFGSLLFCTKQWQSGLSTGTLFTPTEVSCFAWGQEGYSLWLNTIRDPHDDHDDLLDPAKANDDDRPEDCDMKKSVISSDIESRQEVVVMSIAHSAAPSSPHLTCSSDSIILISEDRLYVGPSVPHKADFDHWHVVDVPPQYLAANFPIRYATIDRESKNLAIAGSKGFARYSIQFNEWKFLSKRALSNNFCVSGDIIWWTNYLILSCLNLDTDNFEIRAYLVHETVNYEHPVVQTTTGEIIRMSIFENRLLVLYIDGTLGMFMLNLRRKPNFSKPKAVQNATKVDVPSPGDNELGPSRSTRSDSIISFSQTLSKNFSSDIFLHISPIENLVISNLQANAHCISSISLTRLHFKNNRFDDSILMNACGKLFLLEREAPPDLATPHPPTSVHSVIESNGLSPINRKTSDLDLRVHLAKRTPDPVYFASASLKNTVGSSALTNITFKAVSVIATNVEQFWISPEISSASDMSYFKKSLWLSCGGSNNHLQVWLPLLNDSSDPPTDLYVPDRIMLPIKCDIYPLAIRSSAPNVIEPDDAIVLGAESDLLYKDNDLFQHFPYCTVKRQCRVYLHRVLRELLLNQHLGYYARKIAESCQSLPYFAHCFELLLHEVLEEEATSPVPLPDPMLPQIVRFIKEFPVYLETVVHCARKSELSMWSHLFDERAVGNPRRLFQDCLEKRKLDTAASCLIILQSLDRNIVSQRMVKELIKAAEEDQKYNHLIKDLEIFLNRAELDYISTGESAKTNL